MYASEKTAKALHLLVGSDGPLRVRLLNAFQWGLHVLEADDFPAELRGQFVALRTAVTFTSKPEQGTFAPSIEAMSDQEVKRVAGLVLGLADALAEHVGADTQRARTPSAPLVLNAEMTGPEVAQALRRDLPAGKLKELTELLLVEAEHTAKLARRVRQKRRRPLSSRRVLGLGSNDDDAGKP